MPRKLVISPHFKLIFLSVFGLTILCFVGACILTYATSKIKPSDETDMEKELFQIFRFGWQAGFGAIIGLIGGKVSK